MISKLWPGLSVALIALLLVLWLRAGCNKPSQPDTTQIAMQAIKAGYDSAKLQDTPVIHRLNIRADSLQAQLQAERQRRQAVEGNLKTRAVDLRRTLAALDQARADHDTAGRIRQSDTLEAQVVAGIPAVEGYTHLTDSMINACETQVAVKDSIIFFTNKLLKAADTAITAQRLQFDIVHSDDLSKTKQLSFYKPAAKISIGIILAAILVKFIAK